MSFRATEFEFRNRFWLISAIFCVAFNCYFLDHVNMSQAAARLILSHGTKADSPLIDRYVRIILGAGALLVTLGALIRSWAEAYLHSSVVHDAALHSDRIVADGPYRYLRNPLYVGNILLAVGMGLMASRIGFVVLAGGMSLFVYRLILREEAALLQSQGESYRRYFNAVPRMIPSLRPRVPAGGSKPNWRDGFVGEAFFWSFAAAMAVFAITGNFVYFWIVLGSGFAIYFVQNFIRRPRTPPPAT